MQDINVPFSEVHHLTIDKIGNVPVTKGNFQVLPAHVQTWLAQIVNEYICFCIDISIIY